MKTTICHYSGCFNPAVEGKHFCEKHLENEKSFGKRKATRKRSGPYHYLYATYEWHKLRKEFLAKYPYCCICGQPATGVDHITAHKGNKELFFNWENLQPLCKPHHDRKTLEENNYYKDKKKDQNEQEKNEGAEKFFGL